MSQNCRRIWEKLPAILTYRNFQRAVQVIFVSVPRSKRNGKYNFIPCFKINSVFYKTIRWAFHWQVTASLCWYAWRREPGTGFAAGRQGRAAALALWDHYRAHRQEQDWWQWPGSADRPVTASHVLSDNSAQAHGQGARVVRPGQGQWGAIPGIGWAATKLSHGHRSRAWV